MKKQLFGISEQLRLTDRIRDIRSSEKVMYRQVQNLSPVEEEYLESIKNIHR